MYLEVIWQIVVWNKRYLQLDELLLTLIVSDLKSSELGLSILIKEKEERYFFANNNVREDLW